MVTRRPSLVTTTATWRRSRPLNMPKLSPTDASRPVARSRAAYCTGHRTIVQPAGPHRRAPRPRPCRIDNSRVSRAWLSWAVRTKLQITADRSSESIIRSLGDQLLHLREDAGLPRSIVAEAAGIHPSYLRLIELGKRDASIGILCRVSAALGADLGVRTFPTSGPPLRDRFQARMIEALLQMLPTDWEPHVEVGVARPVRGFIDLVLARPADGRIVSVEAHSEFRRLEQQIRWAADKSDALPSSALWPALTFMTGARPAISRILLLRSTTATRAIARSFARTLFAAYPADPHQIRAALFDPTLPWPGNGILWASVDGADASILAGSPRSVAPR